MFELVLLWWITLNFCVLDGLIRGIAAIAEEEFDYGQD